MKNVVLDTGPLVAVLNARDPEHDKCRDALADFRGQLWTTVPVIAEAMYLVRKHPLGPRTIAEFVASSRLRIEDCAGLGNLELAVGLIEKYADTPMDFADATLVILAHERRTRSICTLDRRGFTIYRTLDSQRFTVLP